MVEISGIDRKNGFLKKKIKKIERTWQHHFTKAQVIKLIGLFPLFLHDCTVTLQQNKNIALVMLARGWTVGFYLNLLAFWFNIYAGKTDKKSIDASQNQFVRTLSKCLHCHLLYNRWNIWVFCTFSRPNFTQLGPPNSCEISSTVTKKNFPRYYSIVCKTIERSGLL